MRCALALIMCSSSLAAMAELRTVIDENFSFFSTTSTAAIEGWVMNNCSKLNRGGGNYALRVGKTEEDGSVTTIDLGITGNATLSFDYARAIDQAATLVVSLSGEGSISGTCELTPTNKNYSSVTLDIEGAKPSTKIVFSGKASGVAIDNIVVQGNVAAPSAPSFDLPEGYYKTSQTLRMSCDTEGATIYYTEDGSAPTDESTVYSAPISVSTTKTIKAVAYKNGVASAVKTAQYYVFDHIYADGFYGEENGYRILEATNPATPYMVSNQALSSTRSAVLKFRVFGRAGTNSLLLKITENYAGGSSEKTEDLDVAKDVWTEMAYPILLLHDGATVTLTFSSANCNIDDVVLVTPPTITLSESADNSATITANSGEIVDVETNRTLCGGIWNTLCLPFAVDLNAINAAVGQTPTVTTYNSYTSGTMNFSSVMGSSVIAAGTPFLLKIATTCANPTFRAVKITATEPLAVTNGGVTFQGIFNPTSLLTDGSDLFIGTDNYLYQPAAGTNTMNGMRAYIHTTAGARVSLAIDDETVAVQDVDAAPRQSAVVYTLQGQRTTKPRRGLYIVDGKKTIVKQ